MTRKDDDGIREGLGFDFPPAPTQDKKTPTPPPAKMTNFGVILPGNTNTNTNADHKQPCTCELCWPEYLKR